MEKVEGRVEMVGYVGWLQAFKACLDASKTP